MCSQHQRRRTKSTASAYRAFSRAEFLLRKFCEDHLNALKAVSPDCREMEVPIDLGRNEAIKTIDLLWNPSSDQFLIVKLSNQKFREPKSLLLVKVLFLLLLLLYLTHWA